jgi:hypothetical protein
VQGFRSSHGVPSAAVDRTAHVEVPLQARVAQLSLAHTIGQPPTQPSPRQISPYVQGFPSVHGVPSGLPVQLSTWEKAGSAAAIVNINTTAKVTVGFMASPKRISESIRSSGVAGESARSDSAGRVRRAR